MNDKELLNLYKTTSIEKTIMVFKGSLTQDVLVGLAEALLKNISNRTNKSVTKKLFTVFVELAQNINRYALERVPEEGTGEKFGVGIIVVNEFKDSYQIVSGNITNSDQLESLTNHLDLINSLPEKELKALRKQRLKSERTDDQKGAGIGLIDIARKSNRPIVYKTRKIDNEQYFISFYIEFLKEV